MAIPYLEGGLVGAIEHQYGLAMAGALEEASVVVLDVAGRDGVAIMVTRGKF
jgi:selenophosphate synthase